VVRASLRVDEGVWCEDRRQHDFFRIIFGRIGAVPLRWRQRGIGQREPSPQGEPSG
jgi:hypothetical protein